MSEEYIKNISEKGNAIIVGRGANSILKEYNPINIFVYANMESKINRCKQKADSEENLTDKEIGLEASGNNRRKRKWKLIYQNILHIKN